jgi:hypothetical protein
MEIVHNKDMIFNKYIEDNEIKNRLSQIAHDINTTHQYKIH